MTLSVGLPRGFELNGVTIGGPGRRVGDSLVYPATVGHDAVQLREYWPADLCYRTAGRGAVAAQQALEQPLADGRERFTALTRALDAFEHPFVPRSTGFEWSGGAYRVEETGRKTLGQILAAGETLPGSAILRLAAGLADALEAVHAAGFLHLDIQPHTVALSEGGIELTGFSTDRRPLMKPAGRQDGLVTPGYSPIELHDGTLGDALGAWTDIHAASALLRRMIVGRAFIDNEQGLRLEDAPLEWPDTDAPRSVITAVEAGLRVHPEDRPQSVEAWRKGWPPRGAIDDQWKALALRGGLPGIAGAAAAATAAAAAAAAATTPKPTVEAPPAPKPEAIIVPPTTPGAGPTSAPGLAPGDIGPIPPLPATTRKKPNDFLRVLLVIGVLLAAILGAMHYLVKPAVEAEQSTPYYVTRGVRVRPAPSTNNRPLTELRRGEVVRGHPVAGADGAQWLKVVEGPHRGQYVWLRNLSAKPRPALAATTSTTLGVQEPGAVLAEPREGAASVGTLNFADTVQVQGTTADGWSELALKEGGVGYVKSSTLGEVRAKSHDPESAYEPDDGAIDAGDAGDDEDAAPADAGDESSIRQFDDGRRGDKGRGKGRGPPIR